MISATSIVGDTVCDVIYRHLQDDNDQLEDKVYDLNPHLKSMPVILPAGVFITLPEKEEARGTEPERVVTRWE